MGPAAGECAGLRPRQAMKRYDPARLPGANDWLALDESERLELVLAYHRRARIRVPKLRLHVALHIVVENQLAERLPEAERALIRLMAEGLDRHSAIHAIGRVGLETFLDVREAWPLRLDMREPYLQRLETLTARDWLTSGNRDC
jgi:hypothetical protein